jgi:sugar phosphate isomerase/epimerase
VGLLLDTFHLYAANERLADALAPGPQALVWVHVADLPAGASADPGEIEDMNRGLPGEHGAVRNGEILASLLRSGYDGPVTAEPMGPCRSLAGHDARARAFRVALALRSVWPPVQGTGA